MRFVTIANSQFVAPPRTLDPRQHWSSPTPRFGRRFVATVLLVTPTAAYIAPAGADIWSQQQSMPSRHDISDSSSSPDRSPRQCQIESTRDTPMLIAGSWRKDKDLSDMEVCLRRGKGWACIWATDCLTIPWAMIVDHY